MPGYERSWIFDIKQDQLEEFICGVCLNVLCQPVVTACCRQSYCVDCIEECLRNNNTCPNDRRPLTRAGLWDAPRSMTNFIDKLNIRCEHFASGCLADIRIGQLADHFNKCEFNKCARCSGKGPLEGHDCVRYLLDEVKNLKEQNAKLSVEKDNTNDLISAIRAAKGIDYDIVDLANVTNGLIRLFSMKSCELLDEFNPSTNDEIDFCRELAGRIGEETARYKKWSVDIYVNNYAVYQTMDDRSRVVLKFGELVIVVSSQKD